MYFTKTRMLEAGVWTQTAYCQRNEVPESIVTIDIIRIWNLNSYDILTILYILCQI